MHNNKVKKLKVFHGPLNYGTQAGLLAKGLREKGVYARSYSKADVFYREIDYHFKPRKTLLGKVFFYKIWYPLVRVKCFFKYNTFHFYFGRTLLENQKDLKLYRLFGKKVIMEHLGNDVRNYQLLVERYNLPKHHHFYKNMEVHDAKVEKRLNYEDKFIDYRMVCLPPHVDFLNSYGFKTKAILPLAIDIKQFTYMPKTQNKEAITIMHAPTNRIFKGTEYIEKAIDKLKNEGYKIELNLVEGVTHEELIEEYKKCDLFIDQISVGWYGTAALEAMAIGRPVCAFIDERYFEYIDYSEDIPVLNINKENVTEKLREIIQSKENLPDIGKKSRKFVENYHDKSSVANYLFQIYNQVWSQ